MTPERRIGRACLIARVVMLGGLVLGAVAGVTIQTLLTPKETP